MQARVLGPLQLDEGGRPITTGGFRQKAVLAQLVLHANHVVPSHRLLVDLWGDDVRPGAVNSLQAAISRLRRVIPAGRLQTRAPGYVLHLLPHERDVDQFEQLLAEGRAAIAAARPDEAARTLRNALSLWRGPALADFRYEPFAQTDIARLEELRLACREERIEADLALGEEHVLIGELEQLVAEHPLRERTRGQLIRALYLDGRQADALEVFRDARRTLRDELGLEPSPQLTTLHEAVLRQDPALSARAVAADGPARMLRRLVTVLSVHLGALPDPGDGAAPAPPLDPEAAGLAVGRAWASLEPVLDRYGGRLVSADGERLIAGFGVVSLHEDDALRAARAALDAQRVLAVEATRLRQDFGIRLVTRFGVATSEALVGGAQPSGLSGAATGAANELAAAAGPGEIILTEQTLALAAAALEVEPAGSGRFRLLASREGARALAVRLDGPLLGRDRERQALLAAVADARERAATVLVVVVGDAGVGKTRLVQDVTRQLPDVTVLTGRCLPYGEGITFWPLREIVRQAVGGPESRPLGHLLRDEPDADLVAARLMSALGPASPTGGGDGAEIFWAARRLLEAISRDRPVVVVVEDMHWAEPMLLDLVQSVAMSPGRGALVLVAITRPELLTEHPAWAGDVSGRVVVELSPLGADTAAALLDELTRGARLPAAARRHILQAAAGYPLYLEQLALSLRQHEWQVDRLEPMPATIQALLTARLERLGPAERDILERAAVDGKDFGAASVADLLPPPARRQVDRHLEVLVGKGLIELRAPGAGEHEDHSFRHILIQEAAYRSIPKLRRARLHEQLADWFEAMSSEPPHALQEILGYHLEQSIQYLTDLSAPRAETDRLAVRAAHHLGTAGGAAFERGDAMAAVQLLERADHLARSPDDRARILTVLGAALGDIGDYDRARDVIDTVERLAADSAVDGMIALARVQRLELELQTDPGRAMAEIERTQAALEDTFRRAGDDSGLCRVGMLRAAVHWNLARSAPAEGLWREAAEAARRARDQRDVVECLSWLGSAALWGPTPAAEGIDLCEHYLAEIGEVPRGQVVVLSHLAGLYALQDRMRMARSLLDRCRAIAVEFGGTILESVTAEPAALVAMLDGDPVAAEEHLRADYDLLTRIGEKSFLGTTAALLAQAVAEQGAGRDREVDELVAVSRETGASWDIPARIVRDGALARSLAVRGRQRDAETLARDAVGLAAGTDLLSQRGDACLTLARVLSGGSDAVGSRQAASEALDLYSWKGNLPGIRAAEKIIADVIHS
jgi:DNA-binding SARP family transcriptional activator